MSSTAATDKPAAAPAGVVRMFGPFQLLRLLGKSLRSMAWVVAAPEDGRELMLVLPRVQPPDRDALERWTGSVQRATRLVHPNLLPIVDHGVQDGWPFVAHDLEGWATLSARLTSKGLPGLEFAPLAQQALEGLAFAHEGGVCHHDLQPYLLLVSDTGQAAVAGLEVACTSDPEGDGGSLQAQRRAAERDVLAFGVVMHGVLAGQPALDEADVGKVISRMPPLGRDIVRLPWTTSHPVADALRAIVNRATDRQERQRYRSARTLARALEGWFRAESGDQGPLALLGDRLRAGGVLPASPGAAAQAARLALMERQRTNELAEVVLQDLALSFELLRVVNTAQVRGAQVTGNGPVLTVRRALALVGLDGVRRAAAVLRPWPGPLNDTGARELERLVARVKRAGRLAVALRPAGYDAEVVYLVALLQNLGRLVVQYHFADEAVQIRRLMQPAPAAQAGEPEEPGMTESAAAFAVIGADIEAIGAAVARHWGLDDSVLHLVRRHAADAPVHTGGDDDETIRAVASAANETMDALQAPTAQTGAALTRVVQRYGRELHFGLKELQAALQASVRESGFDAVVEAATAPPAAAPEAAIPPGGLRAALTARSGR